MYETAYGLQLALRNICEHLFHVVLSHLGVSCIECASTPFAVTILKLVTTVYVRWNCSKETKMSSPWFTMTSFGYLTIVSAVAMAGDMAQ